MIANQITRIANQVRQIRSMASQLSELEDQLDHMERAAKGEIDALLQPFSDLAADPVGLIWKGFCQVWVKLRFSLVRVSRGRRSPEVRFDGESS